MNEKFDWKKYLTLDNIERYAPVAAFFPIGMSIVTSIVGVVLSMFFGWFAVGCIIRNILVGLLRIIFCAGSIGAAAGLAYNQIVGAESAVDINLAKQLNVVTTQLGVDAKKIVMNIGSAAAGYGYEYVVSTMDRIKGAALSQNDNMLQMPIITPVSAETWNVKEAMASEADMPAWGPQDERGIDMEVETAAADLAAGSDAVILRHPESVKTISKLIKALA